MPKKINNHPGISGSRSPRNPIIIDKVPTIRERNFLIICPVNFNIYLSFAVVFEIFFSTFSLS